MEKVTQSYQLAKERYAEWGIDVDAAMETVANTYISVHCWQGDDVGGFESLGSLDGGIAVTGSYPGKATTPQQLMGDFKTAMSLVPGKKKLALHASYAITDGEKVERSDLLPKHFTPWVEFAKANNYALDFNSTYFAHPLAADGFTLSNKDESIREYWITHAKACRKIGGYFGKELGVPCVNNLWIPDGSKEIPIDRLAPRQRLMHSLDKIFADLVPAEYNKDAVESKLFGIGSEHYVVGSHEFYMGYCLSRQDRQKSMLTLDTGHFHPTETVSAKLSAVFCFVDEILLHLSRPVRWDSDHVVMLDDEFKAVFQELVRGDYLSKTHIGLDYFDASINRVAAWVIGARNAQKALLLALLEPTEKLKALELEGDNTSRLALTEEFKTYPFGAVWDYYCQTQNVPVGEKWLDEVKNYETNILSKR